MKPTILIVEDELSLQKNLKLNLEMEGYNVSVANNGQEALKIFKSEVINLIILDIMLPDIDGLRICENIRVQNNKVPILFLSAKNTGEDRIKGLKTGADDYMTKPFELEEFLLRAKILLEKEKLLHMNHVELENIYSFSGNEINFGSQTIKNFDNKEISLSKKEAMLMKLLIEHEGQVVSREHILQIVWGYNVYPNTRTIDNFILNFRKYLEPNSKDPKHFHSIRGVGYKFTK